MQAFFHVIKTVICKTNMKTVITYKQKDSFSHIMYPCYNQLLIIIVSENGDTLILSPRH